jgi:hypothetical protein
MTSIVLDDAVDKFLGVKRRNGSSKNITYERNSVIKQLVANEQGEKLNLTLEVIARRLQYETNTTVEASSLHG